jgi:hypothetical protein
MTEQPKRRLLGISVGVSDEALKRIGLVMVLGASLDHQRMTLLERAEDVPVLTSAGWSRMALTKAITTVYSRSPFDRLADRVDAWLKDVAELLDTRDRYAHSVTYYQTWGDGRAGSFSHHPKTGAITPVVDEPELDDEIMRFADADSVGSALEIETMILRGRDGLQAHDEHLRRQEEYRRSVEEILHEARDS